nr:T9SS type A sorting domain-containing protein [uncultured Psychroserpens sp.]
MRSLKHKLILLIPLLISFNIVAQVDPCNLTQQQLADFIADSFLPTENCNEFSFFIPHCPNNGLTIAINSTIDPVFNDTIVEGLNIFTITGIVTIVVSVCPNPQLVDCSSVPLLLFFEDDCEVSCENFPDIILTNPDDNINSGEMINYTLYANITASNTIENNATSRYQATESIKLIPKFHAKAGSKFKANIKPCPSARIAQQDTNNQVKVFPNPAKDEINVSIEKTKLSSIELYDIYGNRVQSFEKLGTFKHSLNVNRLSRGYYIVKVVLEDGTTQYKNVILK